MAYRKMCTARRHSREARSEPPAGSLQMNGTRLKPPGATFRRRQKNFPNPPCPRPGDGANETRGGAGHSSPRRSRDVMPDTSRRRRRACATPAARTPRTADRRRKNAAGRTGRPARSNMIACEVSGLRSRPAPRSRSRRAARQARPDRWDAPGRSSLHRTRPR